MTDTPAQQPTGPDSIPEGQEEGYFLGMRDGMDAIKGAVAAWIADRRRALSKQGIKGGHDHHDLVMLEQAMEDVTNGKR